MCRLYGFRASNPTRVDCSLVAAQNALLVQSDRDLRGVRNGDGWGMAHYGEAGPLLEKRARAAFEDLRFSDSAQSVSSATVVAHVRAATVGSVSPENTHPFRHGPWVFVHNGTVPAFHRISNRLLLGDTTTPDGATDSEHVFHWMLGNMPRFELDPARPAPSVEPIRDLIASAINEIVRLANAEKALAPPKLNLMLSDGVNLVTSRWGNSLYWLERTAVHDCEVCGLRHCEDADDDYRAVVIASEPLTEEEWLEVPEATILAIDAELNVTLTDLLERQPALG